MDETEQISLSHIPGTENPADLLTRPLHATQKTTIAVFAIEIYHVGDFVLMQIS